ncbi:MAG TPA: ABC transporter substrate-binding protein, partial [Acidobacteriaceae bacterium]|nr:ABC transporter substrate-binding protein [Acidobacteriaceae bacterium]
MLLIAILAASLSTVSRPVSQLVDALCLVSQILPILVIGRMLKNLTDDPSPYVIGAIIGALYSFYPLFGVVRDAACGLPRSVSDVLATLPLTRYGRIRVRLLIALPALITGLRIASAYIVGGVLISQSFSLGDGLVFLGVELNASTSSGNGYQGAVMVLTILAAVTTYCVALAVEPCVLHWRVVKWPVFAQHNFVTQFLHRASRLAGAAIAILFLSECSPGDERSANQATGQMESATLQQEWFAFAGFAGEASASRRTAAEQHLHITIREGNENVDPIEEVRRGRADFGVVAADRLLVAQATKNDIVAIGVANYRTPTVFLVKEQSPVREPRDFVGHRVGILRGTNTEYVYRLMIHHEKVDSSRIRETVVPFELDDFIRGRYDVRPAFVYDEPVTLQMRQVRYRTIDPNRYGVRFLGTVYFTRR